MSWSQFIFYWLPIIGYFLLGRWLGTASRAAWIKAQTCRIQERYEARYQGKLPWSFYLFFPYTSITRRLRPCGAEFLLDRDKKLNDLSGDDLLYVRIHYFFWPVRVAIILLTGVLALWHKLNSGMQTEKRFAKLQKRRQSIREHIKRLHLELHSVDQSLEDLAKHRQDEMEILTKEMALDCEYMPLERGRAPLRPTLVVKIRPCEDKNLVN